MIINSLTNTQITWTICVCSNYFYHFFMSFPSDCKKMYFDDQLIRFCDKKYDMINQCCKFKQINELQMVEISKELDDGIWNLMFDGLLVLSITAFFEPKYSKSCEPALSTIRKPCYHSTKLQMQPTITFIIFWDFLMFYQIFLSPQVKRCAIVTYKHGLYELHHELPNDLALWELGNVRKVSKPHRMIA